MVPEMQTGSPVTSVPAPLTPKRASQRVLRRQLEIVASQAGARIRAGLRRLSVFVALMIVVILLQWAGSAYSSEFSGPDEAAHLVTGLMIRDYIASGFPATPITYAEEYYVHYPKVAFAMWGPLLHVTEAAWTLVFPSTRSTLLVLMAAITAGTAFLVYLALVEEFGTILAFGASCLLVVVPVVQRYTGMIMADGAVALLDFCAAMAFGRYLNTRNAKHALAFAGFVCLSILTKGNGVALLLLPGFAILFTRDFGILKLRSFWVAVAIIGGIAGPWQYYSAKALMGIANRQPGWMFFFANGLNIISFLGIALLPVVAVGIYDRLISPGLKGRLDGKWTAAGALVCSVWVFHSLMPGTGAEVRYLIAAIPPLLLFLVAGTSRIARSLRVPGMLVRTCAWAFFAIVITVFLVTAFSIPQKWHYGFDNVATFVENPQYKTRVMLISSAMEGEEGEGMLISEVAMREAHRPSSIVLRASKMLSQSDWLGGRYTLVYKTSDEIMNFLKSIPVGIVVIHNERGISGTLDHRLLQQAIATHPTEWDRLQTFGEGHTRIEVYRMKSIPTTHGKIRINLPYTLGRAIDE